MERNPNLPTVDKLIKNRVYRLESRNLSFGVWNGKGEFIGIRTKCNNELLDSEIHYDVLDSETHYDVDETHGTVENAEDLGISVPPYITIQNEKVKERMLIQFLKEIEEQYGEK